MQGLEKVDMVLVMAGGHGLQVHEAEKLVAIERCFHGDERVVPR